VVFVGHRVRRYFRKGRKVMQIVFDFSDLNVKRVQRYWKNLMKHFQKLHIRNKAYCLETTIGLRATQKLEIDLDIEIFRLRLQKERNVSCNKREKRVFETKRARGRATRTVFTVVVALALLILAVLSIEISNILQIARLQTY
jgi:predicted nucleic acid-binding Zn ribbon protein